jgi:hypothetical protein
VADPVCKESLAVGDFNFWYFRSYSLQTPNPNIQRAVIVTHGLQRNAGDYFVATVDALNNASDPNSTGAAPPTPRGSTSRTMEPAMSAADASAASSSGTEFGNSELTTT